ncbi:MAG: HAMP domain-containing sensor histidine kinase, partial [Ilumatobacteraceae bacterium]
SIYTPTLDNTWLPAEPTPPLGGRDRNRNRDGSGDEDDIRSFTQILVQVIDGDGTVTREPRSGALPVTAGDIEVAGLRPTGQARFRDDELDGEPYRMLTVGTDGGAVQLARSLGETERVLTRIRNGTLVLVLLSSAAAALLGAIIAQQVTRRLVRLTEAASAVASSGDLDMTVPVDGNDETGRLGAAFNAMLASLARSRRAQHQLVQDAGHELRTPLTSLRTNVEVLQRYDELSPASRERLLADLQSETRELNALVNEIVELATDRRDLEPLEVVVLRATAESVAERARRRTGRAIGVTGEGTVVARAQAVERAISNLVENAVKFSDGPVDIEVTGGRVAVGDRGPGIDVADLSKIFDRFHRTDAARSLPGSGLGLAIVREMAESHGGTVFAEQRPGGGATVGFVLPVDGA